MHSILYHYRTESYRRVSMWKIPFTDRYTDRYRFRVPTEFTDLPTLRTAPYLYVCVRSDVCCQRRRFQGNRVARRRDIRIRRGR